MPLPVAMNADSTGYFCQMNILEHPGPKAQIHLASFPGSPLFFSQVSDAVAYLKMPEQADAVTATYVSDMGAAVSWANPGETNWIAADKALFVVGSSAKGGMDAPEIVPFGDAAQARAFAARNGGAVYPFAKIPAPPLESSPAAEGSDIAARLHALSSIPGD
jgi:copper chaperone NosL